MFTDEWIVDVRKALADIEKSDFNKPNGTYSNLMGTLIAYKCFADIAIEYIPRKMLVRIVADAERICNRIGTSLIQDGEEISRCLTKKHSDCTGSYVSAAVKRTINCKCFCHLKRKRGD